MKAQKSDEAPFVIYADLEFKFLLKQNQVFIKQTAGIIWKCQNLLYL